MELLPGLNRALRRYLVLRGVQSTRFGVDGHELHAYDLRGRGKGTPVVLVHGLGGSANGFYKVLLPLGQRFKRVVAPDLPGNGFSLLQSGAAGLGANSQLEVLVHFLEKQVGEPAFVIGNSLGGAMSITLAHRRPDLVKALGLVAPAGARVSEARFTELIQSLHVDTNAQARAITRRLFHKAPLTALMLAAEMRKMYGTESVRAVLQESKYQDLLEPEVVHGLAQPTLLIWGASEKLLPQESVDFFREHLPRHAELHVVQGFGHIPQMERPSELVRELVGFADRHGL